VFDRKPKPAIPTSRKKTSGACTYDRRDAERSTKFARARTRMRDEQKGGGPPVAAEP